MVHSRHEAPAAPSAAALSTTVRSDGSLRGLRAPPSTALPDSDAAWPWVVWPVAVEPRGRRTEDAALVTPSLAEALAAAASRLVPILDHAGPRAARWSKERLVGASDAAEPQSGCKAEPLDDDG